MRVCPRCKNRDVRAAARFCDMCGGRLPAAAPASPPEATRIGAPAMATSPGRRPPAASAAPARTARARPTRPRRPSPPPRVLRRRDPEGPRLSWEQVQHLSELPEELNIEGTGWLKVDELELRNRESEAQHGWSIEDTHDIFQERGVRTYPDGAEALCRGYLFKGGFARYTIRNLAPGAPVVIIRQVWALGPESGETYVGDYTTGAFQHAEIDLHRPLRNRVHAIPSSLVKETELSVEQEDQGSENGLYFFRLWFYQPSAAVEAQSSAAARRAARGSGGAAHGRQAARMAPAGVALSWESIKRMGRGLPERIQAVNKEWELIDFLTLETQQSQDDHSFAVYDCDNYFTLKLKSTYLDGESVEDSGIRWDQGCAEWTVGGTRLNRDLAMVIRLDHRDGPYEVDVLCDDEPVGRMLVDGRDPVHRWRNWTYVIPGRRVAEGTARVRLRIPEGGKGFNLFRLWFYSAS